MKERRFGAAGLGQKERTFGRVGVGQERTFGGYLPKRDEGEQEEVNPLEPAGQAYTPAIDQNPLYTAVEWLGDKVGGRGGGRRWTRAIFNEDYEETWADLNRSLVSNANMVRRTFGEGAANFMLGEEFMQSVPDRPLPPEYDGARKINGKWYDAYDYPIPPPPEEAVFEPGHAMERQHNIMGSGRSGLFGTLFPNLSDTEWWAGRLFHGDQGDRTDVIEEILDYTMLSRETLKAHLLAMMHGRGEGDMHEEILGVPGEDLSLTGKAMSHGLNFLSPAVDIGFFGLAVKPAVHGLGRKLIGRDLPEAARKQLSKLPPEMMNLMREAPELVGPRLAKHPGMAPEQILDLAVDDLFMRVGESRARLHALKEAGMVTPRLIYKHFWEPLPNFMKPEKILAGVWENWLVPAAHTRFRFLGAAAGATGKFSDEGAKSLAEIFQPAVERLERITKGKTTLGAPFRHMQAQRAMMEGVATRIGDRIAGLKPSQRHEFLKAVKGLPANADVEDMLKQELKGVSLRKPYEKALFDSTQAALKKHVSPDLEAAGVADLPGVQEFLMGLDRQLADKPDARAIQGILMNAIEDDSLPTHLRQHALDLFNVHISTPMAVADAAKKAGQTFLTGRLKQLGVVKPYLRKQDNLDDYLKSQFPGLKGAYVPRDVELELRTLQHIPKISRGIFNKWFLTPWKTNKVVLRPATHIRNILSNAILNDWGGLPFYRGDVYYKAAQEMKRKGKFWKEWVRETGGGGTFTLSELDQMTRGLKYPSNRLDQAMALYDQVVAPARRLYSAEEQWSKMAKFMWNREKGMTPREAALDAMKWTFNYGEVTRFTGRMRTSAAPFFTWQSKVIPLMAETAFKHPYRMAKWPAFYMGLQAAATERLKINEQEWEHIERILPEYIRDGQFLLMPWRDDQDRLQMLNLTYMIPGFGDLNEMQANPTTWLLGHPFLSISSAIMSKTTFGGAPLYHEWEEPSVKFMKASAYAIQQLMPSWTPGPKVKGAVLGGIDWKKIYDRIENDPNALTWEQQAAAAAGFQVKPIDEGVAARKRVLINQIHLQEIGTQMKKDLRRARTPEQREKIAQRYMRLRRKVVGYEE